MIVLRTGASLARHVFNIFNLSNNYVIVLWLVCLYLEIIHKLYRVDCVTYMWTNMVGITILYHQHQCDLEHHEIFCALVGKGGINRYTKL